MLLLDEDESDVKLAAPLTDEQQRFVNVGYFRWAKIRNQWTQPTFTNNQPRPSQPSTSFSSIINDDTISTSNDQSSSSNQSNSNSQSSNRGPAQSQYSTQQSFMQQQSQQQQQYRQSAQMDDDSDSDDDASNVDLRDVMQCLKTYRDFAQPIKLSTMVDIVQVLWDDEEMQQTY